MLLLRNYAISGLAYLYCLESKCRAAVFIPRRLQVFILMFVSPQFVPM
jgi:hypothetical protein